MDSRYVIRPAASGFNVIDRTTGEAAVIAMARQVGLSEDDARHTADLLNAGAKADALPHVA